jgi:hypothetical protein
VIRRAVERYHAGFECRCCCCITPDDDLALKNSDTAWQFMRSADGVRFSNILTAIDLGSIHAGAAPEAFVRALLWLNASK